MASATAPDPQPPNTRNRFKPFSGFIQSTPSNSSPCLTLKTPPSSTSSSFKVLFPLLFPDPSPHRPLYIPLASWSSQFESAQPDSPLSSTDPVTPSSSSPAFKNMNSKSATGFPSAVKVPGLKFNRDQAGPAFVGQVFSMCDLSGTGLMAVSTHFDIPFLSKRYQLLLQSSLLVYKYSPRQFVN